MGFFFRYRFQTDSEAYPASYPIGTGATYTEFKRSGCEVHHSLSSSADVKGWVELYLHSPNTLLWRGAQLKHRDTFIFTFTLD
jgi:hypothetical protein